MSEETMELIRSAQARIMDRRTELSQDEPEDEIDFLDTLEARLENIERAARSDESISEERRERLIVLENAQEEQELAEEELEALRCVADVARQIQRSIDGEPANMKALAFNLREALRDLDRVAGSGYVSPVAKAG